MASLEGCYGSIEVTTIEGCIALTRSISISVAIWKSNSSSSWGAALPYTPDGADAVRSENLLRPLQARRERLLQILFPYRPQLPPAGTLASASPKSLLLRDSC